MRRPLIVLLVIVTVLGGASFALWRWTVGRMESGFAAWTAEAAAQGWTVRTAAVHPAGWPHAAELVLSGLSLDAGPDVVPGGVRWMADRAVLRLSPLAPAVLEVRLEGVQHVRAFGGAEAPFAADHFVLTIPVRGDGPARLDAGQIRFAAPLEGMTIGLLEGQGESHPASGQGRPALTFELSAEAIALPPPPAPQPPLGNRIASATVQGALDGVLPPPAPDLAARAAAWQRSGGLLRVQHLAVGWGPLGVSGAGAIGLDRALQPIGTATLRLIGYDAALEALAADGTIRPQAARAIGGVLGLLARTSENDATPQVELPVELRDGVLSVGRIPVGKIPPVVWRAAP
jgi:hypothetical protein